ncbi:MAG: hypothetical protein KBA66_14990 [Leptospiraceae bacterium]|nr:hypothetical protein [Leptospiraceae bacterium]
MKKIFLLSLLTLVGYYWILFFRFCHPYPKKEFFTVIGIQFGISFIVYIFSHRWGRIITIISGLTLVRVGAILGIENQFVTLMGVFWGAITGILFRELYTFYKNRNSNQSEEFISSFSGNLLLVLFLILITAERFITYFNAPYFNGFGILETMYVKGVSSKEAFALSTESITHILFPLLYFYSEEIAAKNRVEKKKDWRLGILFGLGIQFFILLLQILWDRNFFAENTNLSLEANRVMGLFRDSGSSTWIVPILCFLFYEDLLSVKKFLYFPLISFILLEGSIGFYQGRGYWLLFLLSILFLGILTWKKNNLRFRMVNSIALVAVFGIIMIILYFIPKDPNSSLGRLFLIPVRLIDFLKTGNLSALLFDPHRFYFNLGAWKVFMENPFWGSGFGSFIVNLKDPSLQLYTPENKIDNPSFYLGLISEVGILGVILITLSLFVNSSFRNKGMILILLFVAFSFGYHIVQPDSGFVVVFIWIYFFGIQEEANEYKPHFAIKYFSFFLLFLFLLNIIVTIFRAPNIAVFRKEKLESFQLLAYFPNKIEGGNRYHIFKGKTIWVLTQTNGIELDVFLDNSTSKNSLRQKWSLLDKNKIPIFELEITAYKNKSDYNLIRIPNNAYYLQVEELDEQGKSRFFGDIPFCIPTTHFSDKNEFR